MSKCHAGRGEQAPLGREADVPATFRRAVRELTLYPELAGKRVRAPSRPAPARGGLGFTANYR